MDENMHIVGLQIENVKRITAININPEGRNVIEIGGGNEEGKSSTLDSIMFILGGQKAIDSKPLREGAEKGYASITIGPWDEKQQTHVPKYIVTRTFTKAGGGTLTVEPADPNLTPYKSPQTLLDSFLVDFTFDPTEFAKTSPDKQKEILLRCVDIAVDEAELKRLSGFEEMAFQVDTNPLSKIKQTYDAVYNDRTDVNREIKRLNGTIKSIEIPEGKETVEAVSVSGLFEERKKLEEIQKNQDVQQTQCNDAEQSLVRQTQELNNIKMEIERLENTYTRLRASCDADNLIFKEAKEKIAQLIPPDFTEIDKRIADADETNKIAQKVEGKAKTLEQVAEQNKKAESLTSRMNAIKIYKDNLIASVTWPVEGLGFNEEGEVTYEDIPLNQRGDSQKIKLGLAINATLNPKLKIILIKHGNDLSTKSREKIAVWAKEHGFQLWVELVKDAPDGICFFIEAGELIDEEAWNEKQYGKYADI